MVEGDKYEVLEKIGHGSFGIIRKVRRRVDGQVLCRKEINYVRMSQKEREQLHAEFAILSSLRHPNIVGYYHREHLKSTQDLHLYMEYCGNGDLGRVIKDLQMKKQYAEESFVWSMFSQLVTALYRCHYGIDPPEVGSNVMGLANTARPRTPSGGVMILHRDLKPENVFLGEDNSVKLGDFGLSKLMQSHDFASTYVGTPFYMSPEICAAERYTLKSDIWSLGCIIYELCAREPPFNAKSHFQLVQKIKEGKIAPIPSVYSPELMAVIKDCLKVNPDRRPDTATLLNLPVVKLMRKEKEVVELSRLLKNKEEAAARRLLEAEDRLKQVDAEKVAIDGVLRREWEVKARLEIDRQVQLEVERLNKRFESEIKTRVEEEVQKFIALNRQDGSTKDFSDSLTKSDIPLSSVSTNGDDDFSSTTDLTELSMDSPEPPKPKGSKTPFSRAQTMFAGPGTPMDIEMGEPSPMSIASLSLSPRRHHQAKPIGSSRNIFAAANIEPRERWQPTLIPSDDEDDDDDTPTVPSPTRQKGPTSNPFKVAPGRPALVSQRTAPVPRPNTRENIFAAGKGTSAPTVPTLQTKTSSTSLKEKTRSPNRRLSKIPSSASLATDAANPSPSRKPSFSRKTQQSKSANEADDLSKLAIKNNMALKAANAAPKGRTLVELAQARAGGRPVDADGDIMGSPKGKRGYGIRMVETEPVTWDPERDEMPSPFIIRHRPAIKR